MLITYCFPFFVMQQDRWGGLMALAQHASCVASSSLTPLKGKKHRAICVVSGCTKYSQRGGVCCTHAVNKIFCSFPGCGSCAKRGGVCHRHGASKAAPRCSHSGCNNFAQRKGGLCYSHGGKVFVPICSFPTCCTPVKKAGKCYRHGEALKEKEHGEALEKDQLQRQLDQIRADVAAACKKIDKLTLQLLQGKLIS
jgi:hypothetical protein